jgi:hypothetical protein
MVVCYALCNGKGGELFNILSSILMPETTSCAIKRVNIYKPKDPD